MNTKSIHKFNVSKIILLIVLVGTAICYRQAHTSAKNLQENISSKIIRFHVIANSDSEEDQHLKLQVRDAILELLKPAMDSVTDRNSALSVLTDKCPDIEICAENVIKKNGYDYSVSARVETCYFPTKSYGDLILPPGDYTALNVVIGNSEGKNWWCVMYPSLCFVDCSSAVLPDSSKEKLQDILTYDEYCSVISENPDIKITYSSRIGEWFKGIFSQLLPK